MSDERTSIHQHLRDAAAVVERLDLPKAHISVEVVEHDLGHRADMHVHCDDIETVRQVRRLIGPVTKDAPGAGYRMTLVGKVDGIRVTIWPPNDVCERVQVGTERRRVVQTVETDEFEEVPVYEWDCAPVLVDEPEAVSA